MRFEWVALALLSFVLLARARETYSEMDSTGRAVAVTKDGVSACGKVRDCSSFFFLLTM